MTWVKSKTASGFLTLDNSGLTADDLTITLNSLEKYFGERLKADDKFGLNMDSVAFELNIDGIRVTMGCDIWSGVFIMAWDNNGDKIIEEIESFFR